MDVIREIAKVPTDMYDKPRIPVHIVDCGDVNADEEAEAMGAKGKDARLNAFEEYEERRKE